MATRGHIKFLVKDKKNSKPEEVYRIGIRCDAFLEDIGMKIVNTLKNVESKVGESVERLFLRAFFDFDFDIFFEEEYVYYLTFKPYLATPGEAINLWNVVHLKVTHREKTIFTGDMNKLERLCMKLYNEAKKEYERYLARNR